MTRGSFLVAAGCLRMCLHRLQLCHWTAVFFLSVPFQETRVHKGGGGGGADQWGIPHCGGAEPAGRTRAQSAILVIVASFEMTMQFQSKCKP